MVSRRALGCLFEAVETLVLTLIIFLVIQNFIAQPYKVEQQSMEQTLLPGQYVLVDKLTPRFDAYKRGDIVVFMPPQDTVPGQIPFVKRVIGLPGDVVEVKNGAVLINGQQLSEPYVYPGQVTEATGGQDRWIVPDGQVFVLGDHREESSDSRVFGPVPVGRIKGRAWVALVSWGPDGPRWNRLFHTVTH